MRIAYVILTCEKYIDTRVPWQLDTMFQHVNRSDLYFLGHTMDPSRRLFSWGAPDSYEELPSKFIDFFKNMDLSYDWYILIDDDTFVFHERMEAMLSSHQTHDSFAIGQVLDHIQHSTWGCYLSGGAGTVLSRTLYQQLCTYIRTAPLSIVACHWCADICLGQWIKRVGGQLFHHPQFHADIYDASKDNLSLALTFHHLKEWKDYETLIKN